MERASILQIVSGFKPSIDGMGDFARLLGDSLYRQHQIRSHFAVFRPAKSPFDASEIAPNTISYPATADIASYAEQLQSLVRQGSFHCALLHYGPYGYSSIGKPAALVDAIAQLAVQIPVLTFFHESYSSGPPWKRAFWTHREQRSSMERLQRLSKASFTSNAKYFERLRRLQPADHPLLQIPIFSNMGELQHPLPLVARKRQLIIFGQLATRIRLYETHDMLPSLCRWLDIENIVDIGSGNHPSIPAEILGAPVHRAGFRDETAVSALLAESLAGVIGYWPDVWEKSGVLAAYAAHALLPIFVALEPRHLPPQDYVPYLEPADLEKLRAPHGRIPDATLQAIVTRSHAYYMQNQSVSHCAGTIAAQILSE
jgi:hypothetical protein